MLPRIGIVGVPDQVSLLAPILQSLAFPVTAVWCKNTEICQKLAKKFHISFAASHFQELLMHSEVDLVYVATEPGMHAEIAVKAITSGKHCICQKPPSICQSEAEKMLSLSRYYSQLVTILESHMRFLPAVAKMKELVSFGYCGRLLVIEARILMGSLIQNEPYSWKCDPSMGGGALNTLGSHIIDLVSFVSNQQAKKVHGYLKTFQPHTEKIHGYRTSSSDDFCCFQMHCTGDLSATVTLNTHAPGKYTFEFSVTGTEGRLVVKGMDLFGQKNTEKEEKLILQQRKVEIKGSDFKFPLEFYQPIVLGCTGMFQALKHVFEQSHAQLSPRQRKVLNSAATFEDGIYIRTVLDAIYKSHSSGRWVDIPKTTLVESTNPFWTSSATRIDTEKPSPKSNRPVFV